MASTLRSQGVNTSIRVVSQGKETRIIELRGWLYPEWDQYVTNSEAGWDDWHYNLEVDSAWAVEQGIDLNKILKVGNVVINEGYAIDKGSPDGYRSVSLPRVGLEINGWKPGNNRGVAKPDDWISETPEFLDTRWPFNPRIPLAKNDRDEQFENAILRDNEELATYVRVSGSLVADIAHVGGPSAAWQGGSAAQAEENPARHSEVHPPDHIEVLLNPGRRETLRGIAVVAANGPLDAAEQELNARIAPTGNRPSPSHRVGL